MKIGNLRHRVALQKKAITEDGLKQQSEVWADIATVWARIEPLSGKEYFAAKQINAEISVKLTLRYRKDVVSDMRVAFDGRIFEVLSIINPEERRESLILMCKEVPV